MRWPSLAVLLAAACATARPQAPLPLPVAPQGTVALAARTFEPVGDVRVIEVAVTSEHADALTLDPKHVYARAGSSVAGAPPGRVAPLTPAEAARRAGGEGLPGAVARGAAEGGVRGAATGAVSGGGSGGAIGAAVGAIGGIFRGMQEQPPDVAGFEDRALPGTVLRPGVSETGLVYFPAGDYSEIELILVGEREVVRTIVPVAPPSEER